jgi:hypothetical protein
VHGYLADPGFEVAFFPISFHSFEYPDPAFLQGILCLIPLTNISQTDAHQQS